MGGDQGQEWGRGALFLPPVFGKSINMCNLMTTLHSKATLLIYIPVHTCIDVVIMKREHQEDCEGTNNKKETKINLL